MLNEMEVTGQAFEDMQEQNVRLLQQLREKDDANFKLMSEVCTGSLNVTGYFTLVLPEVHILVFIISGGALGHYKIRFFSVFLHENTISSVLCRYNTCFYFSLIVFHHARCMVINIEWTPPTTCYYLFCVV